MNERYLFRGKRKSGTKKDGEWVTGYYTGEDNGNHYIKIDTHEYIFVDPATLGQCTGLRDKNGTLIFEGDIVRGVAYSADFTGYILWIDEIAGFGVRFHNHQRTPTAWENCSILKNIERGVDDHFQAGIIGNIHDNPELLEG